MPKPDQGKKIFSALYCSTHLRIAFRAARNFESNHDTAIISVVFAAASVEAFVNDLVHMANEWQDEGSDKGRVIAFAEIAEEMEVNRASAVSQLQVLGVVFRESPFSRGEGVLKEVVLLMRLRNALVHARPDSLFRKESGRFEGARNIESILHQLADRKLIDIRKREHRDFLHMVNNKTVAVWGYETVIKLLQEVCRTVPESGMSSMIHVLLRETENWGPPV